jgi:hypothetical protein
MCKIQIFSSNKCDFGKISDNGKSPNIEQTIQLGPFHAIIPEDESEKGKGLVNLVKCKVITSKNWKNYRDRLRVKPSQQHLPGWTWSQVYNSTKYSQYVSSA